MLKSGWRQCQTLWSSHKRAGGTQLTPGECPRCLFLGLNKLCYSSQIGSESFPQELSADDSLPLVQRRPRRANRRLPLRFQDMLLEPPLPLPPPKIFEDSAQMTQALMTDTLSPPPPPMHFPLCNLTDPCTLLCASFLKRAQINLAYSVCTTQTLSLATIQRIHTRLRTHIYLECARIAFQTILPTPWQQIHFTLIQTNVRCTLGTGTGIKVLRSPGTVSRNCSMSWVTPHFHLLPFHKPDGIPSMKNSAGITSTVTYPSGWVKMMAGSVHRLRYRYHFIPTQKIQAVEATPFKDSIIVHLFPSYEKKLLILPMQHSFTMNRMN